MYKDEGITVKDAFNLGITPLRPSEALILKVTPAGALGKCKWRTTIDGSSEKEGEHHHGSSHHDVPSQDSVRIWFAQEANVPIHERCGQADVSSAYNVDLAWETMRMGIQLESSCARPAGTMQSKWSSVPME